MTDVYKNTKAVLTTKHGKELLITKPFRLGLGIEVITPDGVDTDMLGTFAGEIPRVGSMQEIIIKKARIGMELSGLPFGIASEGSYGPHPYIPFISSDLEMLVFIDDKLGFVLIEQLLTAKTNFAHAEVKENEYPIEFLQCISFPQNGIIVKPKTAKKIDMLYKGIRNDIELRNAIKNCTKASDDGIAHLETDMRAHMNNLRRQAIRKLCFKLIRRLRQHCPICKTPGWGLMDIKKGLPCEACGASTELIQTEIIGCTKCAYQEYKSRSDNKIYAEAVYCPCCNP